MRFIMAATNNENRAAKGAFPTVEAAQQSKPSNKWRLYRVTAPDGTACFTWAGGTGSAIINVAKAHGYKAGSLERTPSKDRVAGMLAQLSPEDRAVLVAQFAADNSTPPPAKAPGKKGSR